MWTVIGVALVVLAGLSGSSLYFYGKAIKRAKKDFLDADPGLAMEPGAREASAANAAWWSRQPFELWEIVSHDGIRLRAFYLKAKAPTNKTAIVAHGYSGQASQMGGKARLYWEKLGYNILVPDARGHGGSGGAYIGFGWPERKDYAQWIERVLEQHGEDARIVLHGVSMGAATVMMTSGERLPGNVRAIVADCGYTSVKDELSYQLRRMYKLPVFPLLHVTSLLTKLRAGYFFGEASALAQVRKSRTPILFIHGDADRFVPTDMVYRLYESCPADKRIYIVPNAGHGYAEFADPERYRTEVASFIEHYVAQGS
ncbi:alpha/beta hydrolase [Paenibacillus xanthanilyticus]|uniref:Alpha/beta hydrolase n=1 Tax=Paenibacillus xanthanilyticus TaxID=1783531 RepID=A0ABV8K3T3_9BACL